MSIPRPKNFIDTSNDRKSHRRFELAKKILVSLAHGGIILSIFLAPNAAQLLELLGDDFVPARKKKYHMREQIRRALERLKKRRLVQIYEKGGKTVVELTHAGKKRILEYKLDDLALNTKKKWDGLWRFIVFDIPETRRRARNALSSKLRELGFFMLQKSVWVTPYPCHDEMDFVTELLEIADYAHYIEARYMDDEKKLKLHFFYNKK